MTSLAQVGPTTPYYTAIITLLVVAYYFFLATRVVAARRKFGVKLPAISGHAEFERIYRVHMNMLEWLPTFLAPLWLCAIYLNDMAAAVLGLVWLCGRIVYAVGYRKTVDARRPGFLIQSLAWLLLFVGAVVGLALHAPRL